MDKPATLLTDILRAADSALAEDTLNEQQRTFMQHIRHTTQQLHAMIADIPAMDYALRRIMPTLGDAFEQPQSTLFGYAKMLMEQPESFGGALLSEFQREQATIIYDRGIALAQLTGRLRSEAFEERQQQRTASPINFDLNMLIWQQVPVYRYWIRHEAVTLTVTFPTGLPPVYCNPYHIAEIVQHIVVTMARDLVEQGQIRLSAVLSADGMALELQIFCTGIRLLADDLDNLFQKNGRHVYRDRLADQSGSLHITREPGVGAAVHLMLPLAPRATS